MKTTPHQTAKVATTTAPQALSGSLTRLPAPTAHHHLRLETDMHLADHANLRDGGAGGRWLGPDRTGRIREWIKTAATIATYTLIAWVAVDIARSELAYCDPCEFAL